MTELITKQESQVAIPSFLENVSSKQGLEELSQDSFTVPRLSLLQSGSKVVKRGVEKAGNYQNALTGKIFGPKVELVFIKSTNGAVYMTMAEGLKCKSNDGKTNVINGGKCSECWLNAYYKDWKDNKRPPCSQTFDFIAVTRESLLSEIPEVMAVSFMKTSLKLAKEKIISRSRALNKPLFAQSYLLGSEYVPNTQGDYYAFTVDFPGWLNEAEFKAALALYEGFKTQQYTVQDENESKSGDGLNNVDDDDATEVF